MKQKTFLILGLSFLCGYFSLIYPQYGGKSFSLGFAFNYTTTSKLFLTPNSQGQFAGNNYFPLDDIFSYAINFRYKVLDDLLVELNAEKIRKTGKGKNLIVGTPEGNKAVEIEDGYQIIPVEFSLLYILPFSNEEFQFYMGGGAATYFGKHIRVFGDVKTESGNEQFAYGIQVLTGVSYSPYNFISLRFEMRFRDPEVRLTTKYLSKTVYYKGKDYILPESSFQTKADIDGVTFSFGTAINF